MVSLVSLVGLNSLFSFLRGGFLESFVAADVLIDKTGWYEMPAAILFLEGFFLFLEAGLSVLFYAADIFYWRRHGKKRI